MAFALLFLLTFTIDATWQVINAVTCFVVLNSFLFIIISPAVYTPLLFPFPDVDRRNSMQRRFEQERDTNRGTISGC